MNTDVNRLLDVDKQAQQMLDEAQQYYDRTLYEIEEEKKKMLQSYSERGATHVEQLSAEQAESMEEVVTQVRERTAGILAAMQAQYDANFEQWVDTLVEKCTDRRDAP